MNEKQLCDLAIKALKCSYSPYSECKVGAALLCKDGTVYTGCNIENASFSATVCAERTAFFKALSEGRKEFSSIAIAGSKNGKDIEKFSPCGICRQVMSEFCSADFRIYLVKENAEYEEYTLEQLLPLAFNF